MIPLLPIAMGLMEVVPALAGLLKGKKAEKAAEKVVGIAQAVTGLKDPQEAVEAVKGDPALVLKYKAQLSDHALQGDLAEYSDEKDRRKDIRESGWLSRHVRPVIALTFHGSIWGVLFLKDPEAAADLVGLTLFTWGSMRITIGAAYILIILFYFMTKGMKDYFISRNPVAG